MEDVPYHLDAMLVRGFDHRSQGREIKPASSFHQRPAGPITHRTDVEAAQQLVIAKYLAIVLGELEHVQPHAGTIDMTGRFKTCQKKRIK
jgi:hypothetical protein